jgi:hypothetical protein
MVFRTNAQTAVLRGGGALGGSVSFFFCDLSFFIGVLPSLLFSLCACRFHRR